MNPKRKDHLMALLGALLFVLGLYLVKTEALGTGALRAMPFLAVGVGSGVMGHGMGNMLSRHALRKDPQKEEEIRIEANDERNIAIARRAKARAFDLMIFVYSALLLAFALMGVDLLVVGLLAIGYLTVMGSYAFYHGRYQKDM